MKRRLYFHAEHPPARSYEEADGYRVAMNAVWREAYRARSLYGANCLTMLDWLAILAEEFGEVARAVNELEFGGDESQRAELYAECVQVAAVAVRMASVVKASTPSA